MFIGKNLYGRWLGYLEEYPDYHTQGETLDDLREHLRDLYKDMVGGTDSWGTKEGRPPDFDIKSIGFRNSALVWEFVDPEYLKKWILGEGPEP